MPSSIRSGVLTLLHTACGAGILAMPFGFKPFGLICGYVVLTLCGVLAMTGLLIQARVAKYVDDKKASFFTLSNLISQKLSIIFDLAIAVKCFGVGVSYLIVVGDLIPQIAAAFSDNRLLMNRNFDITMVLFIIVAPLCFLRKLNSLRYASMIAISSVVYLCIMVIVHFLFQSDEIKSLKGEVSYGFPKNEASPLTTLPIFVFAYTCHHNMFSIINEQRDTSFSNTKYIPLFAILSAYIIYVIIGFSGYLTFGNNIVGNIITEYPQSITTTIGRIAIVFLVMLAYPLQCHPARASIHHVLHYLEVKEQMRRERAASRVSARSTNLLSSDASARSESSEDEATLLLEDELILEESQRQREITPLHGKRFIIITTCIIICSYLLAISVTSLAEVLAVVGATGSTSIAFILPGIFGFRIIGSKDDEVLSSTDRIFKYAGLLLIIWGIFVMIASLTATILYGARH